MSIWIVIPAYNEEAVIESVIKEIQGVGFTSIIVVDDGSTDNTYKKANESGVVTLRHSINRGKGLATKTGVEAAKQLGASIVVTMDGDGQHDPHDIPNLIAPIKEETYDVTLGTRLKTAQNMPALKIIANNLANILTVVLYQIHVSDSQSGFRAYSRPVLSLLDTTGDTYEYESEVLREIKRHQLKYKEVPIRVKYTQYSMGKPHKQSFLNGIKTVYKMLWNIIS